MSNFKDLKAATQAQLTKMAEGELFRTGIDKDLLWDTYLSSFSEGTNPIFRERTEHDCQCCRQFIRACGDVVSIIDNKLVSIWDIKIGGHYQVVADALSALVKAEKVSNIFVHRESSLGTDFNHEMKDGKTKKWNHFYFQLPTKFVKRGDDIGTATSEALGSKEVLKRGLTEISSEAIETVLELIEQNSLYRGTEHKRTVELVQTHKAHFEAIEGEDERDNYCWLISAELGGASRARNSVIGTLLVDISEGVELDKAVKSFESKVAPTNYKRPTALITQSMIKNAQKKVKELGIEDSLPRRYAVTEDLTINNVLFADRSVKQAMDVFDEMAEDVPSNTGNLKKIDEVDIDTFIESILPRADGIELLFENKHSNNLMSLIAPVDKDAPNILKWGNNFSWAYNGEVADSLKQRVKNAGGNVDGVLRFSIQWNDGDNNQNDFDAHCIEPDGNLISYQKKGRIQPSSGMLDVDIVSPGKNVAVENITWINKAKIQQGNHKLLVHNYAHNGGKTGFTAEIEYEGKIYSYCYDKELRQGEKVCVAEIKFNRNTGIKFISSLPSTQASKEIWGVPTERFQKVSMIMNSPNHWDGEKTGNKHLFFILEGCKNEEKARGFFNEFLDEGLREHRKVFEVLGSKMKTEKSDNQLSGLGFSSTQKSHVFCKVAGSFTRTIKITF